MENAQQPSQITQQTADVPVILTQPHANRIARGIGLGVVTAGGALGLGAGVAALFESRRAGLVAGGLTAVAALAVRWQLQRWFTDEPAYEIERRIGKLEIRRYEPRVEAHVRVATLDLEAALDQGFRTLFEYIAGENLAEKRIKMTTPVMCHPRATTHTIAFVMPPGWARAALPVPENDAIRLVEQPVRRVAVLRYRGRYSNENFQEAQAELHELVADAGLEPAGEPMFAGFDPPTTLPFLRRCEVWIELQ